MLVNFSLLSCTFTYVLLLSRFALSFRFQRNDRSHVNFRRTTTFRKLVEIPNVLLDTGISSSTSINADDVQNIAVLLGAISYFVWERRPKGSTKSDLIAIQKSTIKNANLGVFAAKTIPAGTIIGEFPGFSSNMKDALASKKNDDARKSAQLYIWDVSDGFVLDPTNSEGVLELELSYLFGLYKVDTAMARINEPTMRRDSSIPLGKFDCNVFTRIVKGNVEIVAERDIFAGEELFMDYGNRYDRTNYDSRFNENEDNEKVQKLRKQQEKEDAMTMQPIIADSDTTNKAIIDQDTSIPDGFLAKLIKQDKATPNRQGILTPEDGADLFRTVGSSMFSKSSTEDQELIKDMAVTRKKSDDILSPETATKRVLGDAGVKLGANEMKDMTDDQLLESLFGVGAVSAAKLTSEKTSNTKDKSLEVAAPIIKQPPAAAAAPPSSTTTGSATGGKRALSEAEADELQQKVDSLTDEELERVFAKMRIAVGAKVFEDLRRPAQPDMPRASPKDTAIRSKYKTELDAIEEELASIYKDPMKIWEELQENPEPLLDGDGDGGIPGGNDDREKLTDKLIDKDLQ